MSQRLSQFIAMCALIFCSPVFFILAILIKLDSSGPVFFRQERVGKAGQNFRIHKFRTMYVHEIKVNVSAVGDTRVTRVGKFLRKTKLDELPQFIDIVQGNMVFVGPRPEVPEYVAQWPENLRPIILSVYPGITDPASIKYRNEAEELASVSNPERYYVEELLPKKANLYAQYAQNRSFLGDLKLIFATIKAVVVE